MEKINILMVDDQPSKLLSYEAILGDLGENLIKAHSSSEALECLLKTDIAVVLMDVCMPEVDGFELADTIRRHPRFQNIAIIFISGVHMTDLDRLRGYEHGAVDYISVPIVPELLRAKVRVFAQLHRKAQELEVLHGEVRRLSSRMITVQDEERRRIARELHDGVGQELVAAKITLDQVEASEARKQVAEAGQLIGNALLQVRTLSHLLHPPLLDEVGLESALQWYVEGFAKRSGIDTAFDIRPADFSRSAPEIEIAIFRIVQEALTNVFRHSQAQKVRVTLEQSDGQIALTVRDDGKGISGKIVDFHPTSIGVGIGGMRQRVRELDGRLRLENTHPGTLVEIVIPDRSVKPESSP